MIMDIKLNYDEETTRMLKKYQTILTKYETRLRELIDNTPNLSYSTRQEIFQEDSGRRRLIRIIKNLSDTHPEYITIVGWDSLIGS